MPSRPLNAEDNAVVAKQYIEDPILSRARNVQRILDRAPKIKSAALYLKPQAFVAAQGNFHCVHPKCKNKIFPNMFSWDLIICDLNRHLRSHQTSTNFTQFRLVVIIFNENEPVNIMGFQQFKEWVKINYSNKTLNPNGWRTVQARDQISWLEEKRQELQNTHPTEHNEKFIEQILEVVYSIAVPNPEALNGQRGCKTYGEVRYKQIKIIVNMLKLESKDTVIDLGSGVGCFLTTVAALRKVKKCVGIELEDIPAAFAVEHHHLFEKFMDYFGKPYSRVELHKGTIFDVAYRNTITREATVIFVNKAVFGADNNEELAKMFVNCKDGTRIISTKEFTFPYEYRNKKYMDRGGLAAITTQPLEIATMPENVTWVNREVKFYLTTISKRQ